MKVCDRCRQPKPLVNNLKLFGKEYELCKECSETTRNYILFSYEEPKGLAKLGKMFES